MIDDMRPRPGTGHHNPARRPILSYHPRPTTTQHHAQPQFRPPEEVAAQETAQEATPESGPDTEEHIDMHEPDAQQQAAPKKPRRSLKEWLKSRTKKQWIIIIVVAVLVLGGLGTGAYFLFFHKKPAPVAMVVKKQVKVAPKPTTMASNLTGLQVDPSVNQRPVTAVMIENSEDARPQSALDQAGVVFEAVAEGGITRFEALFQDTQPGYIGPVRSVRPYYIQWGMGFDAAIAHVGGSPEALQDLKDWKTKNLDQFAYGSYFQRIGSRVAPHNVYTSMSQLNEIESKNSYGAASFTSLLRKKDAPLKTPNAGSIDVNISSADFNSHYDYDAATNSYKRSQAGGPHMVVDQNGTQTQIQPKVVVALTLTQGLEADDHHTSYGTIGTGHAYIFQDGTVAEGTWKKSSNQENLSFTDSTGKPIALNAGQTWFAIVGDTSDVTYK